MPALKFTHKCCRKCYGFILNVSCNIISALTTIYILKLGIPYCMRTETYFKTWKPLHSVNILCALAKLIHIWNIYSTGIVNSEWFTFHCSLCVCFIYSDGMYKRSHSYVFTFQFQTQCFIYARCDIRKHESLLLTFSVICHRNKGHILHVNLTCFVIYNMQYVTCLYLAYTCNLLINIVT